MPTIAERWTLARAGGMQTFDPGVPCVNGHVSDRWTNNGICIECKRARDNAYNAAHKEEHGRRTRESVARRQEEVRAYRKRYYREHAAEAVQCAGTWQRAHPEKRREFSARYKEKHPEVYTAAKHRRRAREAGARSGCRKAITAFHAWAAKVEIVPCYWCGKRTRPGHRHIDHIIPLARGGADTVENLCIACPTCNMRKQAKMPEEFAGQAELRFA